MTEPIEKYCMAKEMSDNMTTSIIARIKIEGTHFWPNCHINEVKYLKHEHRHLFHIIVKARVSHDDRDIEFIELGHKIRNYLFKEYWDAERQLHCFGPRSCEMLARELLKQFDFLISIEVNEDGEGGAIVEV